MRRYFFTARVPIILTSYSYSNIDIQNAALLGADDFIIIPIDLNRFLLSIDPGLHRSILGDGVATITAGLLGGPPNTTYGENIGVMAITRVYSVWVIGGAAIIAIVLSFIGPVAVIIANMPLPVIGGVSILLFGIIASSGFRIFVEDKIDFGKKRNLIISSVIIVLGIGGASIQFYVQGNPLVISGVALATIVGIFLNLVLPQNSRNEE